MFRFSSPNRRRTTPLAASLLYLLSAAALPVLHAQVEGLEGAVTIEAYHSTQCEKIHSDTSCPATSLLRALCGVDGSTLLAPTRTTPSLGGGSAECPVVLKGFAARFIRGPPST